MSDTPRTDAEKPECLKSNCGSFTSRRYVVSASFARQLERELTEALSLKDDAMKHLQPVLDNNDKLQDLLTAAEQDRDRWRKMAEEFGRDFHNYPNVPSHQRCLETLSRFNAMKGEKE